MDARKLVNFEKLNITKKFSLANLYLNFSIFAVIITILSSVIFATFKYREYQFNKRLYISEQAAKLNLAFSEKINAAENMTRYVADKLVQSNDFSYKNIAFLIRYQSNNLKNDSLAWSSMSFINPERYLVVDSLTGVRKQPIQYSVQKGSWIENAFKQPWALHFNKPDVGLITNEYEISTGFGINTEDGRFVGYLSTPLNIMKLTKNLIAVLNENINFILLNKEKDLLLPSLNLNHSTFSVTDELEQEIYNNQHLVPHCLSSSINIDDYILTHKINTKDYPFIFLVGQNTESYYQQFRQEIMPHIIKNIAIGMLFTAILLLLSYIVVRPIIELSNIADDISQGKHVNILEYEAIELNNLSSQLKNLQTITQNLRNKQAQLTKANSQLRNANEFIQSNMSFLSHELRNPISSIIGFSKLLREKLSKLHDQEMNEYIDFIFNIAMHQDKQINFFLKLFEFQEKGKRLEYKEVNLTEVIESNINMVMHHANRRGVKVTLDVASDLPNILGDDIMIGQMIQNFAANGAKYNKVGGYLEIKAFTRFRNQKKEIIIQFKDTGIGIKADDLQKIFKRFERIQNDKNLDIMGYGLGLAFAKSCVLAHDGEIEVISEPDRGSIFTVIFPRTRIINKT